LGLDIYFYKLKKNENVTTDNATNWSVISDECDRQSREKLTKVYDRAILSLTKSTDYKTTYKRVIRQICKFSNYPHFHYHDLGVSYDYKKGVYSYDEKPIEVFLKKKDDILKSHSAPHIAYFRKANFVYNYFSNKLIDEIAWVTKEDLEDLIDKCKRVLNDHNLAEELLPTRAGFFFGSTDYDEWYFNDVKDCLGQMKKVLKGFADNELVYVVMSW